MKLSKSISDGIDFMNLIAILQQNQLYNRITKILDVGAGQGTLVFKTDHKKYYALEKDPIHIEILENKLNLISGEHQILNFDFLKRELSEKFDLVILNNFLTVISIDKFDECLSKCYKILNSPGIIFIRVNSNFHGDIEKAKNSKEIKVIEKEKNKFFVPENGYIKNYFSESELKDLVQKNKFKIETFRREDEIFSFNNELKSEFCLIAFKENDA